MSDKTSSYPYKHQENLSLLTDNPQELFPRLIAEFYDAIDRAKIPDADVVIRKEKDVMTVYFREKELHQKFMEALTDSKEPAVYLTGQQSPLLKAVDFNPDNYIIAHTEKIGPGMDSSGEVRHCIDVCEMCNLKNFKVIANKDSVTVYVQNENQVAVFIGMEFWVRVQKERIGLPISTGKQASATTLSLVPPWTAGP